MKTAIPQFRMLGNRYYTSAALWSIGGLYDALGSPEKALEYYIAGQGELPSPNNLLTIADALDRSRAGRVHGRPAGRCRHRAGAAGPAHRRRLAPWGLVDERRRPNGGNLSADSTGFGGAGPWRDASRSTASGGSVG